MWGGEEGDHKARQEAIRLEQEESRKVEAIKLVRGNLVAHGLEDPNVTVKIAYRYDQEREPLTVGENVSLAEAWSVAKLTVDIS